MRSGRGNDRPLRGSPLRSRRDALRDAPGDEALRVLRDQAAAIEAATRAAERPAWLDANIHPRARAAAKVGQEQLSACVTPPLSDACRTSDRVPARAARSSPSGPLRNRCRRRRCGAGPARARVPRAARGGHHHHGPGLPRPRRGPAQGDLRPCRREPGVRVAFRGVAKDEPLAAFVRQIHALLAGIDPVPEVVLDPRPFEAASGGHRPGADRRGSGGRAGPGRGPRGPAMAPRPGACRCARGPRGARTGACRERARPDRRAQTAPRRAGPREASGAGARALLEAGPLRDLAGCRPRPHPDDRSHHHGIRRSAAPGRHPPGARRGHA